ncbi:hypothetical protein ACKX2L_05985 [Lachnospiraceae bacterium YH-ros2228]
MKLVIDIPKEFERDWDNDKFQDCFGRVLADLKDASFLSGNYEKETLEMLQSAFRNAKEYDRSEDVLIERDR